MRIMQLACVVAATVMLGAGSAQAQLPWPGPGTEHLPPDPSVPYLAAVSPLICLDGAPACLTTLATKLRVRTRARLRSRRRVQRRVSDDHPGDR